ncbi:MAG: alanine racemase [Gemmatimonadetes bacterium]|nr:alanine racemase [Gemmatimonadota bacterium]
MSNPSQARAWIDIGLGALRANYETLRRVVGERRAIIVMVKADGYGLGAERVVRALESTDPWGYGVAATEEGVALRRAGVRRPIVVFNPLAPQAVDAAAEAGLVASISDVASIERWAAAAGRHGPLSFHVEIDTGMGRAGFDWRETSQWASHVLEAAGERTRWEGVYTHFHSADSAEAAPTVAQWERFRDAVAQLPVPREALLVHAANSAAALRWPEVRADAVRPGIFLYGGRAVESGLSTPSPMAVAAVRARVVHVRSVPPGSTVGYGATHVARGWERWATLAIGYGDGLRRALGNRGRALLRGCRVPIVGRISMDMTVVEVSAVPDAVPGDIATLLGADGESEILLDDVATEAGTIAYEILTGLTPRLPRMER